MMDEGSSTAAVTPVAHIRRSASSQWPSMTTISTSSPVTGVSHALGDPPWTRTCGSGRRHGCAAPPTACETPESGDIEWDGTELVAVPRRKPAAELAADPLDVEDGADVDDGGDAGGLS